MTAAGVRSRIPRKTWILGGSALAVAVILAIRVATADEIPGDFARYYRAGEVIASGEGDRLYEKMLILDRFEREHHFHYLPTFAILMAPLALLPMRVALWVWSSLHVLSYVLGLVFSWRIASGVLRGRRRDDGAPARVPPVWLAIPVLFTLRLFVQNLQLGQVNPIVMALALGGALAYFRGRDLLAGTLVALGASIKFTPALFLVLFVAQRRWWAVTGLLGGVLLFAAVLPATVLGPARTVSLTEEYVDLQGGLVSDADHERLAGQSLRALYYRFLTPMNAVHQRRHNDPIFVNFASLEPEVVYALYVGSAALLFLLLAAVAFRRTETWAIPFVLSLGVVIALLASPESRRAHFTIVMLPYATLTVAAIRPFFRERRRPAAALLALLAMLAITVPSRGIVGRSAANVIDAWGNMGFAALLLVGALLVGLRGVRREREEPEPPHPAPPA